MIGISELDSLSTWELIQITWSNLRIRIPERPPLQTTVVESINQPRMVFEEMSQEKIITLCKMEIEHRFGLAYVRDRIEIQKERSD